MAVGGSANSAVGGKSEGFGDRPGCNHPATGNQNEKYTSCRTG